MKIRVLVTGGCGFLGRTLTRLLIDSGHLAVTFDNLDPLCGGQGQPDVNGDVTRHSDLSDAIHAHDITHIAHLAAYGRNLTCQYNIAAAKAINVAGTVNVLKLCKRLNLRGVICSSNITLSDQPTVYRGTKRAVESTVQSYQTLGASVLCLRPSNIHGPGQSRTEFQPCAFAGMDIGFERDGFITITGDGRQTRDFIHVRDVARAFLLALDSHLACGTLDICTGVQTSMNKIVEQLGVEVRYADPRPGDARSLLSNPGPAYNRLGYKGELKLRDTLLESFPAVAAMRVAT